MISVLLGLLLTFQIVPDNSSIEYTQPHIAVGQGLVGVTFGSGKTIYFSGSKDFGQTFSKPVVVAQATAIALGMHRGPRIAITPDAIVVSAVFATKLAKDGDLMVWRSTDGGQTWSSGIKVNDVEGSARESLHAMVAGPKGELYTAWLDLRSKGTQLFGAGSTDGGLTWSKDTQIYKSPSGSICNCCHPSLTFAEDGKLYAMWRNDVDGSRDLYFSVSTDGGKTFPAAPKLGNGTWEIDFCPMDGGGIAVDDKRRLTSVWRRQDSIYLAVPGQSEILIGQGKDPAITITNEGVYTAWSGPGGIYAQKPGSPRPSLVGAGGTYVSLAGKGPVFAVWENKGTIVVSRLDDDR
jgi:hypothetical protein